MFSKLTFNCEIPNNQKQTLRVVLLTILWRMDCSRTKCSVANT